MKIKDDFDRVWAYMGWGLVAFVVSLFLMFVSGATPGSSLPLKDHTSEACNEFFHMAEHAKESNPGLLEDEATISYNDDLTDMMRENIKLLFPGQVIKNEEDIRGFAVIRRVQSGMFTTIFIYSEGCTKQAMTVASHMAPVLFRGIDFKLLTIRKLKEYMEGS